jgi:hypothetical protein
MMLHHASTPAISGEVRAAGMRAAMTILTT